MIELRKWIEPDIVIILLSPKDNYSSSTHAMYSIVFSESLMIITDCDEHGRHRGYGSTNKYYGLKLAGDKLEVCIPKFGWIPIYDEIQEKYNNTIADKELLEGKCNSSD